jgi:hypothetical protein
MTRPLLLARLAAATGLLLCTNSPGIGQTTSTSLELGAGAGYTTNPFLRTVNDEGSAFARLSASGIHRWSGERGFTSLRAYLENSTYLSHYSSKRIFDLNARTEHQANERMRLFGSLEFSGDLAGQLSNRFVDVPVNPEVPDPTEPPPVNPDDPDLFSFTGRQFRLDGQAGAAIKASERSNITISGGAHRVSYKSELLNDYTTLFAYGAFDRVLSERTTAGVSLNLRQTNFDGSDDRTTTINPAVTAQTRFRENWDASAAVGLIFAEQGSVGDKQRSTNVSLSGSVCHTDQSERFCGRLARYAQSASRANLVITTSAGIDWFKKLDATQTLQLSASAVRYVAENTVTDNLKSNHFQFAGNYSRKLKERLSVGANAAIRSLRQQGPNPNMDISGSVFLRYRVGDRL